VVEKRDMNRLRTNRKADRAKFCTHVLKRIKDRGGIFLNAYAEAQQYTMPGLFVTIKDQECHKYEYAVYFRFKPLSVGLGTQSQYKEVFRSDEKIGAAIKEFDQFFDIISENADRLHTRALNMKPQLT
jgi:hypothetical protein